MEIKKEKNFLYWKRYTNSLDWAYGVLTAYQREKIDHACNLAYNAGRLHEKLSAIQKSGDCNGN